jgi:FKBP-type peptidyl-prolyl cis-trans isomerase
MRRSLKPASLMTLALLVAGLLVLVACGGNGESGAQDVPLTSLEPGIQSISYAIGMDMAMQIGDMPGANDHDQQVAGLRERLADRAKLDDIQARDILQAHAMGLDDAGFQSPEFASQTAQRSYAVGVTAGSFAAKQFDGLDGRALVQGLKDRLAGGATLLADDQIGPLVGAYQQEQHELKSTRNLTAGQAFLAENGARAEVTVTESGLQYEMLREGDGPRPEATDTVTVHYRGTLLDGTQFDSSYDRGEPISFALNRVIAGWTEALQLVPVGSHVKLYIPSHLAYGERGAGGDIGPNATLIFEVELLGIKE